MRSIVLDRPLDGLDRRPPGSLPPAAILVDGLDAAALTRIRKRRRMEVQRNEQLGVV
jgi:hypothetical protein